jgi:hypothetical protein
MTYTLRLHNSQDVAPETQPGDDEEGTEMMPPAAGPAPGSGQVEQGSNSEAPGVQGGGGRAEAVEASI